MTSLVDAVRADVRASAAGTTVKRIALLGVGQVGGALAALVREAPAAREFAVVCGLVRDTDRQRPHASHVPLTTEPELALAGGPDLVIEALGGQEPACALVLEALRRGIPVVTANKSLLAWHGDLLLGTAAEHGAALRYEASVLAGVPFLGTFTSRPLARDITGFTGIVNGTTNFILSRMADEGSPFAAALAEAQQRGYAEPDPGNDVNGVDAAEKLCVLLRHFGGWSVRPTDLHAEGISELTAADIRAAAALGGVLKPVVSADWADGAPAAFAGPAFVAEKHPLARVDGVQNAIVLRNRIAGDLIFAGPGAGPRVTAATMLDDASEIAHGAARVAHAKTQYRVAKPLAPETSWFLRVTRRNRRVHTPAADLLARYGVSVRREWTAGTNGEDWCITHPCKPERVCHALRTLSETDGCETFRARVL